MEQKKDIRTIDSIKPYEKNPRGIDKKNFELLKKHIKKLGQFKPIIINQEGIILGGCMRYQAYKALGIKDIWVSEVNTKNESEIIQYNLIDNQRYGYYDDDALAELIYNFKDEISLEDYKVDMRMPIGIDELLSNYAPDNEKDDVAPKCPLCNKKLDSQYIDVIMKQWKEKEQGLNANFAERNSTQKVDT